jgi:hypothetical protein
MSFGKRERRRVIKKKKQKKDACVNSATPHVICIIE